MYVASKAAQNAFVIRNLLMETSLVLDILNAVGRTGLSFTSLIWRAFIEFHWSKVDEEDMDKEDIHSKVGRDIMQKELEQELALIQN